MKTTSSKNPDSSIEIETQYNDSNQVLSISKYIDGELSSSISYEYTQYTQQLKSIHYNPTGDMNSSLNKSVHWTMEAGRLKTFTDAAGNTTRYAYNYGAISERDSRPSTGGDSVHYTYYNDSNGDSFNKGQVASLTYQPGNNAKSRLTKSFIYDAQHRPIEEKVILKGIGYQAPEDSLVIRDVKKSYDKNTGNIRQVQTQSTQDTSHKSNQTQCYRYNTLNQLVESYILFPTSQRNLANCPIDDVSTSQYEDRTYTYDINQNLLQMTRISEPSEPAGKTSYHYNHMNQITSITTPDGQKHELTYDTSGNLQKDIQSHAYHYNLLNQLTGYSDSVHTWHYKYYPSGLRSHKSEDDSQDIDPIYFYYDGAEMQISLMKYKGTK